MSELESNLNLRRTTRFEFPNTPTDEALVETFRSEWSQFQDEPPVYGQGELQGLFEIWRGSTGLKESLMELSVDEVKKELKEAKILYGQPQTPERQADLLAFIQLANRCIIR